MLYLSAKHSRSLVWWENSIRETFWETILRTDHSVWFIGWVLPISAKDQSRIHQFGKESLTWIVPWVRFVRGRIWKVDMLVADIEELETMDASEIYSKRLNAKEVIFHHRKWKIYFSSRRWTNQSCRKRSGTENTHLGTGTPNSRRMSRRFSWRIRRVSSTTSRLTSGCRWSDKWFLVHVRKLHIPPSRWTQSQTLLAERGIIPIPLKYKQERRIDDYWNIDGSRDLSDSWTGFTHFTLLEEKPPDGYMWFGRRLTIQQLISRPNRLWPELWVILGRNAKLKEKQKWSNEKPKLDNARRWRGIYFVDPLDKEFKETIKNAGKKLETPMAPAMPCKTSKKCKHGETRGKTNLRVSWKPVNPEGCLWKNLYRIIMRTILQERETIHCNIIIWYTNLFLCLKSLRFPQQKQQWIKNGRNWKRFRRGSQSSGSQWESTPSWRRSKSGLRKSSTSKTHENCEGSISST